MNKFLYSVKDNTLKQKILLSASRLGLFPEKFNGNYSEDASFTIFQNEIPSSFIHSRLTKQPVLLITDGKKIPNNTEQFNKRLLIDILDERSAPDLLNIKLNFLAKISGQIKSENHTKDYIGGIKKSISCNLLKISDQIIKEINQPLTTLLCNAQMAKELSRNNRSLQKKISRIEEASEKITEQIKRIESLKSGLNQKDSLNIEKFKILCIEPFTDISEILTRITRTEQNLEIERRKSISNPNFKKDTLCIKNRQSFLDAAKRIKNHQVDLIFAYQNINNKNISHLMKRIQKQDMPTIVLLIKPDEKHMVFSEGVELEYLRTDQITDSAIARIVHKFKIKKNLEHKLQQIKNKLHELPMRDNITGLYSKRWLYEILPKEMARAKRYQHPLCITVGKIKELQDIKKSLGHFSGDRLLSILGSILLSGSRTTDFCCKIDNNFAILLPDTDKNGGEAFTKRINSNIKFKNFFYDDSTKKKINIKWGICEFSPSFFPTAGEMLESAFSKIEN